MPERSLVVASAVGLHARPAALFVRAAVATGLPVTVGRPDSEQVDARSILRVMSLGVKHGESLVLRAEGAGADEALDALVAMLEQDLDADV